MLRKEYPRMDFRREDYVLLNGSWDFLYDDNDIGLKNKWYKSFPEETLSIEVPFAYQSNLSGIASKEQHDIIWYKKDFEVEPGYYSLNFGAIDFDSIIYLNGERIGEHRGAGTPIKLNINLEENVNTIVVRVYDPLYDEEILRGKQFWEDKSRGIWYTPTSGIWQTVWLDKINESEILKFKCDSNLELGLEQIKVYTTNSRGKQIKLSVYFEEEEIYSSVQKIYNDINHFSIDIYENKIFRHPFHSSGKESICWTPEHPFLFQFKVEIIDDEEEKLDVVHSYFGFRTIEHKDGQILLNNNPYYFKLILDQGYYKNGLLTAESDEDFVADITNAKKLGFNGCRKHQKVEDPRFLYWADTLGFLVWGEVSNCVVYTDESVKSMTNEWFNIIERDYNHPSIVAWVPLNESWGVPFIKSSKKQQSHSEALYHQIKSLDDTRLVLSNDGWEQTVTDICAIHNYSHGEPNTEKSAYFDKLLADKELMLSSQENTRPIYAYGYEYVCDTPIMLTEFGGIAYNANEKGWGYTSVESSEDLVQEYARLITSLSKSNYLAGFCYTQLYDVEQETNGFMTYDREFKCNPEDIKKINDSMFRMY